MKGKCTVIFLLLILLISSGCYKNTNDTSGDFAFPKTLKTTLRKSDVEWITMTGGLGGITTKVLFSDHNDNIINKIIEMFNKNNEMRELDSSAIETTYPKTRPIGIVISLRDGNKVYLWPSYKEVHYADGNGATVTTLKDRFIIQIEKDGICKYYEVFSNNIAEYLLDGWKEDMPIVNDVIIESDALISNNFENLLYEGDEFTISGDGCTCPVISIFICNSDTEQKWLLGKTEPELGAWLWNGFVDKKINTVDGIEVQLPDGIYDLVVDFGDRQKSICGIICIGANSN